MENLCELSHRFTMLSLAMKLAGSWKKDDRHTMSQSISRKRRSYERPSFSMRERIYSGWRRWYRRLGEWESANTCMQVHLPQKQDSCRTPNLIVCHNVPEFFPDVSYAFQDWVSSLKPEHRSTRPSLNDLDILDKGLQWYYYRNSGQWREGPVA